MGVIEALPVDIPVTLCHRKVACAKNNYKPRRAADVQASNAYATRETHQTQSPPSELSSTGNEEDSV